MEFDGGYPKVEGALKRKGQPKLPFNLGSDGYTKTIKTVVSYFAAFIQPQPINLICYY